MNKKIRNTLISILFICISIGSSNCKKDETPNPSGQSNEVSIHNMSFTPGSITIKAGEEVNWTNDDGTAHTVTSNDGLFDSGSMASGDTFSYAFPDAGTYSYHCAFHGGMTGTVIVE